MENQAKIPVTVTLAPSIISAIDQMAERWGVSRSACCSMALREGLDILGALARMSDAADHGEVDVNA